MSSENENWQVLHSDIVLEHSAIAPTMEQVSIPNRQMRTDWLNTYTQDYVNALVLNDAGEAMILEGYKPSHSQPKWQVIGGSLAEDEDPYTAVQRELLEETGYSCKNWRYLGSYSTGVNQHTGVGHFFYATGVRRVTEPIRGNLATFNVKWVSVRDLKYALLDGRIGAISYAVNIALALLTIENICSK